MTHAGQGDSVNLAALWVPIMPSTSELDSAARAAGVKMRKGIQEGIGSGGVLGDPDKMGSEFAKKFGESFNKQFNSAMWGRGLFGNILERTVRDAVQLGEQVDATLAKSIQKKLPGMLNELRSATDSLAESRRRADEASNKMASLDQRRIEITDRLTEATQRQQQALAAVRASGWDLSNPKSGDTEEQIRLLREHGQAVRDIQVAESDLLSESGRFTRTEQDKTRAVTQHTVALQQVKEHQDRYNDALKQHGEASASAFNMSSLFAGMLGGAMVLGLQGVISGFEKVIELGIHLFEEAIHGAEMLGEKLVDIGEDYDHLAIQIREFSGASGEAFAEMQEHVDKVYASLDVAGKNTGQVMAQLKSMLGAAAGDPALDTLTQHVVELQGRFANLKAEDIGSIFYAFHTPVQDADADLASLLQSARDAGIGLGDLANLMAGQVSYTMQEAGLNIQQAGHFTAELAKSHIPARQAIMGLSSAMKVFASGKSGTVYDFADGMKEAAKTIKALEDSGDTTKLDAFSEALFGNKWALAKPMVDAYFESVNAGADAFAAPQGSLDQFRSDTEDLGSKLEEFKHKLEGTFKPFGEGAKDAVEHGLDLISQWFSDHHEDILRKVNEWGDKFIDILPDIKAFADGFITMMAPVLDMLAQAASVSLAMAAGFMMSPAGGFDADAAKRFMERSSELGIAGHFGVPGTDSPIDQAVSGLKDKVDHGFDGIIDESGRLKDALANLTDSAMYPQYYGQTPGGVPSGGWGPGITSPSPASPGGATAPEPIWTDPSDLEDSDPDGLGIAPGEFGSTRRPATGGVPGAPGPQASTPPVPSFSGSGSGGNNVGGYQDAMIARVKQDGAFYGLTPTEIQMIIGVGQHESNWKGPGYMGFGPEARSVGLDFSNNPLGAVDQFFKQFVERRAREGNPNDPRAVADYIWHVVHNATDPNYGPELLAAAGFGKQSSGGLGFSQGGEHSGGMSGFSQFLAQMGFGPKGKDTELAYYTPGEYVWDTDTTDKYGWLIKALHGKGRYFGQGSGVGGVSQVIWSDNEDPSVQSHGGDAGYGVLYGRDVSGGPGSPYSDETNPVGQGFAGHHGHVHTTFTANPFTGEPYTQVRAGTNTALGEWSAFPPWVHQLGDMYGLDAKTYAGHQEWDGFNHGIDWYPRGKLDMSGHSYTHQDNQMLDSFAHAAGAVGTGQGSFGGAMPPGGGIQLTGWGAPGSTGGFGGGSGPGGSVGPGGYGGMPGQFGGSGVYGGETQDQVRQHQKEVEDRQYKVDVTLPREIQDKQTEIDRLNTEYTQLNAATGLARDEKAIAAKQIQLQRAQQDLDRLQKHDLPEAQQDLSDAERKQQEAAFKRPEKGEKSGADSAARSLGGSFLGGLAQSMGFPDVFGGKAPWDWGIVKILGGLANWGFSGVQGMAAGGNPVGIGPNVASGLGSSVGFPKIPFQGGGPIQVPGGNLNGSIFGGGPAPGPGGGNAPASFGLPNFGGGVHTTNYYIHPKTDTEIVSSVKHYNNSTSKSVGMASAPGAPPTP